MGLLKWQVGFSYGCTRNTLNATENKYIKQLVRYESEILNITNIANHVAWNGSEFRIEVNSGAVKATPILHMHSSSTKEISQSWQEVNPNRQYHLSLVLGRCFIWTAWRMHTKTNSIKFESLLTACTNLTEALNVMDKVELLELQVNYVEYQPYPIT